MADPRYPDVELSGLKTETQLPDLQLPVYRGDQGQMTPQRRKVMAYLQALKARRMQQGGVGFDPTAQQGGGMQAPPMPPQGMPPQGGQTPPWGM